MTEKQSTLFTAKVKERLVLLLFGSVFTLITVTFTLFFDQYLLRAEYNEDEFLRIKLFTESRESLVRIEEKINTIDARVERIDKRVNKIMDN